MLALAVCLLVFLLSTLPAFARVLANGTSMTSGRFSSSVHWQSSGILTQGECPTNVALNPCFTAELASTGDESGNNRQRIEMFSWRPSKLGESWVYDWEYYLVPGAGSSDHFFHLMQLFSRDAATFLIGLDLFNGAVRIFDTMEHPKTIACPSIPLAEFEGKTTKHHMEVTFGSNGTIDCNSTLLTYNTTGNVSAGASLKTGLYRLIQPDQTNATAHLGDFSFVKTE
ncbi:hypothetical protein BCR35DRAFT_333076 [Leucosporidium creatinivorum]|uniref:Concanavalin A-like lectin/glucanase domain-containing protein n=1 Tax=Leucosporidium creatinivorum TaxID=106004 RepID=A0A1Y2EWQ1_9BASI|nr:hypothetical protein BCR35DRAFT_333076 [Leucosporidium creatinivorum]